MAGRDTDPRSDAPAALDPGIAPVVALPRQGLPRGVLIGLALAAAVILFVILDARRLARMETSEPQADQSASVAPPPPLYVPGQPAVAGLPAQRPAFAGASPAAVRPVLIPASQPAPQPTFVPVQPPPPSYIPMSPPPVADGALRGGSESALVIDQTGAPQAEGAASSGPAPASAASARARASRLQNPSTTVAQGTLLPAVLETGFDSTWPGYARAVISRDVRGFDGTRILIPRGSRLVGEYRSDAAAGQRRAMINWTRLVRPDGAAIAIGSPVADAEGRGGVRANVNTHFVQRLASAVLQSVIDVGASLASRRSGTSVIVAAPGAAQGFGGLVQQAPPTPTLTVRPGTSISVFVARDLDFTPVERGR